MSIPLDDSFGTWLGWVVDLDRPIVLVVAARGRPGRPHPPGAAHRPRRDRRPPRRWLRAVGGIGSPGRGEPSDVARRARAARWPATRARPRCSSTSGRPSEYEAGHVPGAWHINGGSLPDRLAELPRDRPIADHLRRGLPGVDRGLAAALGRLRGRRLGRTRDSPHGARPAIRSNPARRTVAAPIERPPPTSRCQATVTDPRFRGTSVPPGNDRRAAFGAVPGCHHRLVSVRHPVGDREPGVSGSRAGRPASSRRRAVGLSATPRNAGRSRGPRARPRATARSRSSSPSDSTPSSASPSAWPPRTIARSSSGRSSTRPRAPCAPTATTIRILQRRPARGRRLGRAARRDGRRACRSSRRDEGWVGEVLRTGRVLAWPDVRADRHATAATGTTGVIEFARRPRSRRSSTTTGSSAPCRRSRCEPRDWTSGDVAFITTLATHAAIALTNAELFEQTEARAAQLGVLQAASARLSRAGIGRGDRPDRRRGDAPDHRLPQRPGVPRRAARRRSCRSPSRARVGAYEQVDFELLRCRLGEGFTGWVAQHGEPLLINDANARPARRARSPGTDDVDESMLVVPMRYDDATVGVITLSKLGSRPVRRGRPAAADDPRRPGRDRGRDRPGC